MESTQYLLESISIVRDDLKKIENKVDQLYNDSKYVFRRLILELYEYYREGECYVPCIEDVDSSLKLSCSRKDVGAVLNWIRELLSYLESCDDEYEYIIECMNNKEIGIDIRSEFKYVQEAILCIEHELNKSIHR